MFTDRLWINNSSNIRIEGIDFADDEAVNGSRPFVQITNSAGIDVVDAFIVAAKAGADARDPADVTTKSQKGEPIAGFAKRDAILVQDSEDILLAQLDISGVRKAIRAAGVDGLTIANNHISDLREDGLHISAVRNVLITDNLIENPSPFRSEINPSINDHPDLIAISSKREAIGVENVVIQRNVLRADDGVSTQGLTISNSKGSDPEAQFKNVFIVDNIINTISRNALQVIDISSVVIENNVLLQGPREDGTFNPPRIVVETLADDGVDARRPPTGVVVHDNLTMQNWVDEVASYDIGDGVRDERGIVDYHNMVIRPDPVVGWTGPEPVYFADAYPHLLKRGIEKMADLLPAQDAERFLSDIGPRVALQALDYAKTGLPVFDPNTPRPDMADLDPYTPGAQALLIGSEGRDRLDGGKAAGGVMLGLDGDDRLRDSLGDDNIFGGAGRDRIYSASGDDLLSGGGDRDRFYIDIDLDGDRTVTMIDLDFGERDEIVLRGASEGFFDFAGSVKGIASGKQGTQVKIKTVEGLKALAVSDDISTSSSPESEGDGFQFRLDLGGGTFLLRVLTDADAQRGIADDASDDEGKGAGSETLDIPAWELEDSGLSDSTLAFLNDGAAPAPGTKAHQRLIDELVTLTDELSMWAAWEPSIDALVYNVDMNRDGVVDRQFLLSGDWDAA